MKHNENSNTLNTVSPFWNGLFHVIFTLYSLACIIPLLLVIGVSFTDEKTVVTSGYNFIPKVFSLEAYKWVVKSGDAIVRAYGLSIMITIVGTILSVSIIAMFAYVISRKDFKYRNTFSFIVFFTMIFNGGLVPWYMVYTNFLHINDTLLAYIIPSLVNAWYVMIMRTFFQTNVPDSIIESAKIDGAGEFRTFIQIVIPLAKPGLATIALFQTLGFWNDWYLPLMLIENAKLYNLQYILYKTLTAIQYLATASNMTQGTAEILAKLPSETARMAMCVLAIGPIILAYPFFQKYFVKGLTVGAVKG
ncbi:L-arabinose transport system permease protein AraQ [Ruminiclostridium hungatei]|uniref:L-arabinose transport system permease protein AraQ n=1 Tax=Ruminiclostridium hungatei TaxID=48256 RepID=A0A1V4SK35_RUMHU|nr:carbohydrate ABC transporter permease [Ruminiclostridium hungatei]OPX44269.1 L-arabinose transport system permease protein AraQ [Ruminiclostridium hungatei]